MPHADSGIGIILIVEDNRDCRETLADLLDLSGYEVDCAANGQEALDHLRKGRLPALILLDWSMPVMGGREFLLHKQADPRLAPIPVVAVSAVTDRFDPAGLGLAGQVQKPLDFRDLLKLIFPFCGVGRNVRPTHEE
jgi:CheY-like chemotaxis protein